jgi:hypothetical protein
MFVITGCHCRHLTALGWEERREAVTVKLKLLFSTRFLSTRIIHVVYVTLN